MPRERQIQNKCLKTPDAARFLNCSVDFLKDCREIKGRFLKCNTHYFPGLSSNSPILWDVELIQQVFIERGILNEKERIAERILKEGVGN